RCGSPRPGTPRCTLVAGAPGDPGELPEGAADGRGPSEIRDEPIAARVLVDLGDGRVREARPFGDRLGNLTVQERHAEPLRDSRPDDGSSRAVEGGQRDHREMPWVVRAHFTLPSRAYRRDQASR